MIKSMQKAANKVALPFNFIALIGVMISGWFTYQNNGLDFTVWLPIALVSSSLILSIWGRKF